MNCSYIKDYLKTGTNLGIEKFYCGKIDNKYEKAICVYDLEDRSERNIAVGGSELTTQYAKFSALIRWNKNFTETETAAQNVYDFLANSNQTTFSKVKIDYIEMLNDHAIDLHCGDDGIFERLIDFKVYYR